MSQPALKIEPLQSIDTLSYHLANAKLREEEARQHRIALETAILELIPEKEEGSSSETGDHYKATATFGMTRKITNVTELSLAIDPELFNKLVRVKHEINTKTLKSLQDLDPQKYLTVSRYLESRPRKPSVKVEDLGV